MNNASTPRILTPGCNGIRPYINFLIMFMDGRRVVLVPVGSPDDVGRRDDIDDRQIVESSSDTHGGISTTEDTQNIQTSQSGRSSNTSASDQSQANTTQNHTDFPS